jgi:uncharacterized protein YbjT (DUF2867 family)
MFVVAGSSGQTGSVVAETLLSRGEKVRLIVRDERKVERFKQRGADVANASLLDAAALTEALRGARGVYLLLPPNEKSQDMLREQSEIIAALASALRASRPEHVVLLSSIGAQHAQGTGPIRALHEAERVLSAAVSNISFVRAAYFMENLGAELAGLAQGVFPSFLRPDLAVPMVATRDIGVTAAQALLEGGRGRSIIELEGPRRYTAVEVASELSRLVGKPITLQTGPESAIVSTLEGFGLPKNTAELYCEMIHGINVEHVAQEGGSARHVLGATPLGDVLAGLLRGAAQA